MTAHDGQASATAETPELLLQLAVEKAALVAWSTDRELRVTSFRAQTRGAAGKPPEDRRGMTLSTLFQADTADSQPVAVHRRALGGESGSFRFDWEGMPYRADVFPHKNEEGHVVGCLGFAQAVTEQDQLRRELDAIFEYAPVAMILVDHERRVKRANRLAGQAAGRLSNEMTGLRGGEALRCVHSLDVPEGCGFTSACKDCRIRSLFLETMETGKIHQGVEVLFRTEVEGKPVERFVLVSAARVNPREKAVVLVCLEDITDRKQMEDTLRETHERLQETLDELRMTQEQVIQQERLRALGEMASGVGHDLNNSLSPVLGYSEILLEDSRLPGDAREHLKWIHDGARDAAAVVARLREFYRPPDPGELQTSVELGRLLDEIVQLTRPKWRDKAQREGREIELEVRAEDAPLVLGNAAELREVLTNLVFNAVDAMPSGGRIELRLRGQSGGAVVEVADTGVGMSDEVRAKCIEPFFTTKGHEGTGLGLSVCHGIVQRHGGRIEIDSLPGEGTTVRVLLPAAEEGQLLEEPVAEVSLPASRVLYIDDDPRLRGVVGDMLRQLGQEVDLAEGGARGLELVAANNYDLVITDLGMPGMDGYVVTGKIKALRPHLPVAMLTGWGSSGPAESMVSGEFPDYILSKPPPLDEIRRLLMKLMP